MWTKSSLAIFAGTLITVVTFAGAPGDAVRYRGNYTCGHEVNADYDGLITVSALIATCVESSLVIESDLQHHRWVLDSIDGEALLFDDTDNLVPDLDFGGQMHVSGNTGCNRFSGKAELNDEYFQIPGLASTKRLCSPPQNELERRLLTVLTGQSRISIDEEGNLFLATDEALLKYRPRDWVK